MRVRSSCRRHHGQQGPQAQQAQQAALGEVQISVTMPPRGMLFSNTALSEDQRSWRGMDRAKGGVAATGEGPTHTWALMGGRRDRHLGRQKVWPPVGEARDVCHWDVVQCTGPMRQSFLDLAASPIRAHDLLWRRGTTRL